MTIAVRFQDVSKRYLLGEQSAVYGTLRDAIAQWARRDRNPERRELWALRGLDLEVEQGEVLGIVGPNGAGKSTLLKLVSRITAPSGGSVGLRGRVGTLLDIGTGFHPELTGRENIYLNGAILGMRRREIDRRFDLIVEFSGIETRFLDTPLKRYSAGMRLRLAFSVAAHLDSDVLVVDEVLAVGDAEFRRRCVGAMSELAHAGRTVLFVSHDLGSIGQLCERAIWLDHGVVAEDGAATEVVRAYGSRQIDSPAHFTQGPTGDDTVSLRQAALVGEFDEPRDIQVGDEPLRIAMRLHIKQSVLGMYPAVMILDERGVAVVNEGWGHNKFESAFDGAGTFDIAFEIPSLLAPGTYSARLWVGTAYDDHLFVDLFSFEVIPGGDLPDDRADRPRLIDVRNTTWRIARAS